MKSGYAAYGRTATAALGGRRLEAQAFAKAAALLEQAATSQGDLKVLAEALKFNNRLWAIVQAEITAPDCSLPENLRGEILSLSLFMDKQTIELLAAGPDAKALNAMAEVNRSLATGLLR